MKTLRKALAVAAIVSLVPAPARADQADLERRLAALEQEVALLKRQLEVEKEVNQKKAQETATVTASAKDGFTIKSQEGDFKLRVRGLVQADGRFFTDNKKDLGTTDTFVARRIRPAFEGTVFKDFDYFVQPDFGNNTVVLQDGWGEYKRIPEAKLRVGKFKEPLGLERMQSDANGAFVETGPATLLTPNRDVGAMLHGEIREGLVAYQLGLFNGVADGASTPDVDVNNDKDFAARIFAHPFKEFDVEPLRGLGAGVAATFGHQEGSTIGGYRSAGQATVFSYVSGTTADGPHTRFAPQAYWYLGPFGLQGEYVSSTQEVTRTAANQRKLRHDAWQLIGTYVVTGEDATYNGVKPRHPFDPSRGEWGAFELAGRYGELSLDDDAFNLGFANRNQSVSRVHEWAAGVNWYPNRNVKLMLDYIRTDFDEGGPLGEDRKAENAILTRAQIVF